MIILEGADAELAASNAAFGSWTHQGQICMATGRVLVHEKLAPTVMDLLSQKAKQIKVGNPAVEEVAFGPLITRRQLERWIPSSGILSHPAPDSGRAANTETCFIKPRCLTE